MGQALTTFLTTVLPMAVGMMVVGTIAAAAQGGVTFATKAMKPTLKKLNPFPGIKRMFGTQGLWEATKALLKRQRSASSSSSPATGPRRWSRRPVRCRCPP